MTSSCPTCRRPYQNRAGMTPVQRELYEFIVAYVAKHGCAPSLSEIADETGPKSKPAIHQLLKRLEERGYIKRIYGQLRGITVVELEAAK